ncbi:hypothetical protein [Streptomyces zhihengii]
MRTTWRDASVLAAAALLLWTVPTASQSFRQQADRPSRHSVERPPVYRADCRTEIDGSAVTAYCHNPNPGADRVRLHVECDRWWDVDADTAAVDLFPAGYAELTQRCWKEIRAVWVSHQPPRAA